MTTPVGSPFNVHGSTNNYQSTSSYVCFKQLNQQHQAEHKADMRYHIGHTFTPKKLSLCQHVGK